MKKSNKLFIVLAIVIGLFIGFLVGISVDFPNPQNAELSGTIGRINNYRNVKINESDIKLRSELQSNELLLKSYLRYLSFHYASSAKLFDEIDKALIAIEAFPVFAEKEADKLLAIQTLQSNLEEARKDILLALASLQNISEGNEANIGHLINNANIAIAKVKYLENSLLDFMEITASLLDNSQEQNKEELKQLALSHDQLLATKIASSYITKDKPMLKYLDQKKFYSSETEFRSVFENSKSLEKNIGVDAAILQNTMLFDQADLGMFSQNTMDAVTNEVNSAYHNVIGFNSNLYSQGASLGSIMDYINSEGKLALINVGDLQGLQNAVSEVGGLGALFDNLH